MQSIATDLVPAFPLCLDGRTLYRFVLRIGRAFRTLEQWHEAPADAAQAAREVCEDWRGSRQGRVVLVYPVPGAVAAHGHLVGGP